MTKITVAQFLRHLTAAWCELAKRHSPALAEQLEIDAADVAQAIEEEGFGCITELTPAFRSEWLDDELTLLELADMMGVTQTHMLVSLRPDAAAFVLQVARSPDLRRELAAEIFRLALEAPPPPPTTPEALRS